MEKTRYYPLATFEDINYVLIDRAQAGSIKGSRFVVAWAPIWDDEDFDCVTSWGQGHYFDNILDACGYIEKLIKDEEFEITDEDYASNKPCDTYGMCAGISCSSYWKCMGAII